MEPNDKFPASELPEDLLIERHFPDEETQALKVLLKEDTAARINNNIGRCLDWLERFAEDFNGNYKPLLEAPELTDPDEEFKKKAEALENRLWNTDSFLTTYSQVLQRLAKAYKAIELNL